MTMFLIHLVLKDEHETHKFSDAQHALDIQQRFEYTLGIICWIEQII